MKLLTISQAARPAGCSAALIRDAIKRGAFTRWPRPDSGLSEAEVRLWASKALQSEQKGGR